MIKNKTLKKLGTEGSYLNIVKVIYDKSIDNIILHGVGGGIGLKAFSLKVGIKTGPLSNL
jgi:hypothetical protein